MTKNYSSPKEALLAAGRIKEITRGRISRDNNAWIDDQIAKGAFTISGMTVTKSSSSTAAPIVKRTVQAAAKIISDIPEVFRDEDMYDVADESGNRMPGVGMRNVDNRCGNSFTYCMCREPRIYYGDREVKVTFIPKARKK